jgi:hypothetical protein
MSSQTDLKIQHPEAVHSRTHWDDSDSDEATFGAEPAKVAIEKTVSCHKR